MTKDKALQIVLYALELEDLAYRYEKEPAPKHIAKAITAVKEALAQPEQEPVAWMKIDNYLDDENLWCEQVTFNQNEDGKPLYTAPPAKPWVGLTDEQRSELINKYYFDDPSDAFMREFEAKLKEKNT